MVVTDTINHPHAQPTAERRPEKGDWREEEKRIAETRERWVGEEQEEDGRLGEEADSGTKTGCSRKARRRIPSHHEKKMKEKKKARNKNTRVRECETNGRRVGEEEEDRRSRIGRRKKKKEACQWIQRNKKEERDWREKAELKREEEK